ncbi:hypothetical protein [Actinomyces lilanjuaniae]|uniref:hypothetical protein n=1 Tax=Actinomyces lilanjuaniae TaxID=2321394 RepID=UPI0013C535EE|nr:hypothetical protein [Actinomyces lilanjuaniae]
MRSPAAWRLAQLLRTAAHDLLVVASAVAPWCVACWVGLVNARFGYVFSDWPVETRHLMGTHNRLWTPGWLGWTVLFGVGLGLSAGAVRYRVRDWWAIVVACSTAFWWAACAYVSQGIQFMHPENRDCTYEGCWPLYWQAVVVGMPMLVALVVVVLLGWWAGRVGVWVRRVVPGVVFVGLMLLLALVWQPWVLPFLQGPPPWQGAAP